MHAVRTSKRGSERRLRNERRSKAYGARCAAAKYTSQRTRVLDGYLGSLSEPETEQDEIRNVLGTVRTCNDFSLYSLQSLQASELVGAQQT